MNATLSEFRGRHAGETIIVCGCGTSLRTLVEPQRHLTIGVNDVGRLFDPTYLVVVNPPSQLRNGRFPYVQQSNAKALFTQLDLGPVRPPVVRFKLGQYGGTEIGDGGVLHYTQNSPYVAVCLAAYMGARRIGLIGVDLTDDHFFARTGRHSLAGRLREIDAQFAKLAAALGQRGIELVNLSHQSRLSSLPKVDPAAWPAVEAAEAPGPEAMAERAAARTPRVFFVHYQFLSCGDVFRRGLENAAGDLGLAWSSADCADVRLRERVESFRPDLLFVVHGRAFRQRWAGQFRHVRKAVWLLDEPYEVDDTAVTSRLFDLVFVNDAVTLGRHAGAHYLPVAWDPHEHTPGTQLDRRYGVGFIGGGNPSREALLRRLAQEGLLSYVVGGPWGAAELKALSLGARVPPARTAELYRQTRLVVNVFRDRHHYNRQHLAATSLNPRIYEALACGALVVSEERPELKGVFPELPSFRDAGGLVAAVRDLLANDDRRREALDACRSRLAPHTYAERLRAVLALALPRGTDANGTPAVTECAAFPPMASVRPAETSILMAVHGGLPMTRLAVTRTLRHSARSDARLIVVDNASTDGTREWLRLLAQRGDLDLLESPVNRGHGPALELARRHTASPYLVTLDSDAFPVADDWLSRLRGRLDEGALAAGILHHRGYIHPSCLMVARRTLDEMGLDFLDEKGRPSGLDVAERITVEIRRRGHRVHGLRCTGTRRGGSRAEPVRLGSTYEGLVYHQWYTTRAATVPGRPVDDVPREELDRALAEVLEDGEREPRDVTVVVGVRAGSGDDARRRNARATLTALNYQDLERYRYRVVVVEQDDHPRLSSELAPLADRHVFAYNGGAYNRGWGFNVGVAVSGTQGGAVCLMDADLLVPPDFLRRGLEAMRGGVQALLPYRSVRYLSAADTARAIAARLETAHASPPAEGFPGRTFGDSQGGALWVDAALYRTVGGHDERFRGWGCEDREICQRLERAGHAPRRLDGCLLHLDHPRPPEGDAAALANQELYASLSRLRPSKAPVPFGDPKRYAREAPTRPAAHALPGRRAWEHWQGWAADRIGRIVVDERAALPEASARRALAELAVRLGSRLLDLGCGPGALWPHLAPHQPRVHWIGTDVTAAMLEGARRCFPDAPVVQADAGRLPWRDGSFDVVVMRHLLEYLPPPLMQQTLAEAFRVARRAVLLDFYVPTAAAGAARTNQVGEGFLETRWTKSDIEGPATAAGWVVRERRPLGAQTGEDEIWILAPGHLTEDLLSWPSAGARTADETLKFSIVMPTFKRPHRLGATVATVLAQTYRNWELIIVDNAGDCDVRFADPRISMVTAAERTSAAHARNQGVLRAVGDLVCFFDDDDDMFPEYLQRFAAAFCAHPEARMARCGMIVRGGRVNYSYATPEVCLRREYATPTWGSESWEQDQLYFRRIVSLHGWTERRDIVRVNAPLCRANSDPRGGLRAGRF